MKTSRETPPSLDSERDANLCISDTLLTTIHTPQVVITGIHSQTANACIHLISLLLRCASVGTEPGVRVGAGGGWDGMVAWRSCA
jgi:hypothetical protein